MEVFITGFIFGLLLGLSLMRSHKSETIGELLDMNIKQRWRILELENETRVSRRTQ